MTQDTLRCPWSEQTVLLALHALDGDAERAARRHVLSCAECPSVLADAEETLAEIGATAAEPPPPRLRDRVLAAIEEPDDRVLTAVPPQAPVRAIGRPRRWASAVAAAVVLAGLVAGGIAIGRLDQQRDASTVHAGTIDDLLASIRASQHAVLAGRDGRPVAAVVLTGVPRFYDLGLPPAAPDRTWVLWGMQGRTATALAAVQSGTPGVTAAVPVGTPGQFEAYVLTDEASGPLPARQGEPVASGQVVPAGS